MNFDGPVRVADGAKPGTATVTLSFDAWKGAAVRPTTHTLTVLPKAGPKEEPTAPGLVASLSHPDRTAALVTVRFSPDGKRLIAAGYPSGVVQVWDVAGRKEVRRIDTPPGRSLGYALLAPDGHTLYVPVVRRSVRHLERAGKRHTRVEFRGEIRVWDVDSGKEKEPLRSPPGAAPAVVEPAPGGRFLVSAEWHGYDDGDLAPKNATVLWDLASGGQTKLCDGLALPSFGPGGKTVVVGLRDPAAGTSVVKVLALPAGKELARRPCPEKGRQFSVGPVAPDGSVVAVYLVGKATAPVDVWFLDARTLEVRGKLAGKGERRRDGWGSGCFTPDGRRFVALNGTGDVVVWDVAGRKAERVLRSGADPSSGPVAVSPDGRTFAVAWMPGAGKEPGSARGADPQDLPQPRVSLVDLAGGAPPRTLVAPHGYVGGLAFSPDGTLLTFGGAGAVYLFDLRK